MVPFAWSLRRQREFDKCPRSFYYRYYGARGGHEAQVADFRTRRLYLCRDRLTDDLYLQRVVNMAMRERFRAAEDAPFASLFQQAERILRREFPVMLLGDDGINRHLPVLERIADPALRPEALLLELRAKLEERCKVLMRGDWQKVAQIPAPCRRHLPEAVEIRVGELLCHAPVALMWQQCGTTFFVEGVRRVPAGDDAALAALLHRYYALSLPGTDAGKVVSLAFDDAGKLAEFGAELEVSAALRKLRAGADRLAEFHDLPEAAYPRNTEACAKCFFRRECPRGD